MRISDWSSDVCSSDLHTGDIVVDAQPVELVPPRHQDNRKAHPDDATVKGHAALPQLYNVAGVREEARGVVEQHIGQSAAQDDAKRRPGDEIVRVTAGHGRAWRLQQAEQIPPADEYAGDIGEAVPAELQEAEVKRDGRRSDEHTSELQSLMRI